MSEIDEDKMNAAQTGEKGYITDAERDACAFVYISKTDQLFT